MDWNPADRAKDQELADYKARRARRIPLHEQSSLTGHDIYKVEVRVRDLSPCGFMAECSGVLGIGSYVSLDVPGIGPVEAQVRWQIGGRMGGMFLDPINLVECEWAAEKTEA